MRNSPARLIALGVLSYPVPSSRIRERALDLTELRYDPRKIRWLNRNLRTISRIIVHPQFRGIGLARELVRTLCQNSDVRYVEAMAHMGRAVPFFERAGMTRHEPADDTSPIYYLWDRNVSEARRRRCHPEVTPRDLAIRVRDPSRRTASG
jgi:ABC-type ATPase with predicted acetyltransferase domain